MPTDYLSLCKKMCFLNTNPNDMSLLIYNKIKKYLFNPAREEQAHSSIWSQT